MSSCSLALDHSILCEQSYAGLLSVQRSDELSPPLALCSAMRMMSSCSLALDHSILCEQSDAGLLSVQRSDELSPPLALISAPQCSTVVISIRYTPHVDMFQRSPPPSLHPHELLSSSQIVSTSAAALDP